MEIQTGQDKYTEKQILRVLPLLEPRSTYISTEGLYKPSSVGVDMAQQQLDTAIASKQLLSVRAGIRTKVVEWFGLIGTIAGFDHEGNQVGYGQVFWNPDPRERELSLRYLSYRTAYIVGTDFGRRGVATAMKTHLENFAAIHNNGIGAAFHSTIDAITPGSIEASKRLLDKLGAVHKKDDTYMRFIMKRDMYSGPARQGIVFLEVDNIQPQTHYSPKSQRRYKKRKKGVS
ncbi:hypothetical protein ACFLY9_02155 [Patescibacteria group bacterium]